MSGSCGKYIMAHFPLEWQRTKTSTTPTRAILNSALPSDHHAPLDDVLGVAPTFHSAVSMPSGSPAPLAGAAAVKPTHRLRTKMKSQLDRQEGVNNPKRGLQPPLLLPGPPLLARHRSSLLGLRAAHFRGGGMGEGGAHASRSYASFIKRRAHDAKPYCEAACTLCCARLARHEPQPYRYVNESVPGRSRSPLPCAEERTC